MIGLSAAKRWAGGRIERVISQAIVSPAVMKYVPYKPTEPEFTIPRTAEPTASVTRHRDLPIPPLALRRYGSTEDIYVASAETHVATMRTLLANTGFTFKPGDRILDHGCGAGRMIRCLIDLADMCEIWGTDIQAECIYWCKQHLAPPFHFATTTTIPHLPFEDRYFTLLYCGSVFTHIDDLADAWLLELRRVLAPGGRAYLTIHDNHTLDLFEGARADTPLAARLRNSVAYQTAKRDRFGMLVINRSRQWYLQVFYDIDYFCRLLQPMYRVLSVTPEAYGYQTAVIVERR
jgi:ubiquinone/menaquinone biosynthesis C-methylase UbiE